MSSPKSFPLKRGLKTSQAARWIMGLGAVAMVLIGLVLLLLLTQATNNRALYDQNYDRLYIVNLVVAGFLLIGIVTGLVRLIFDCDVDSLARVCW